MKPRRYELSDFEWSIIEPLLPNKPRGVPRSDDRKVLNGIYWRLRTGSPWAEIPERYGPATTCYNRFVGAVTRTEFGRLNIGELDSDSGCGGGSPRPESFFSEDAERAAGCEMALEVESVLDGGVNGQEALG